MSWVAHFDGTCPNCDGHITADHDHVDWDGPPGGHAHVVHTQCPDPLAAPTGVCPTCHLTLPVTGICGTCWWHTT